MPRAVFIAWLKNLAAAWALGAGLAAAAAAAPAPVKLALIAPGDLAAEPWVTMLRLMQAAAADLDLTLAAAGTGAEADGQAYLRLADQAIADGAQILIVREFAQTGIELLKRAETAGVRLFVINAPIVDAGLEKAGQPRQRFSQWIGSRAPDDVKAGQALMAALIGEARSKGFSPIRVLAFSGSRLDPAAPLRARGMHRAIKEAADVTLLQDVPVAAAADLAPRLEEFMRKHADANVIWCWTGLQAGRLLPVLAAAGRTPGQDILIGGVDWSGPGLAALEAGQVAVAFGGLALDGLAALLLAQDAWRGRDFRDDIGLASQSELVAMPAEIVPDYRRLVLDGDLGAVDFRGYSVSHGGRRDFTLMRLLDLLRAAEAEAPRP